MSFATAKPIERSAAWRISAWGTLVFALGTTLVFIFLDRFVAEDIQRRNDAWLWGEVSLLADVSERTPKDELYGQVVGEIAELVRKGIPSRGKGFRNTSDYVFFLEQAENGSRRLWVGAGSGDRMLAALKQLRIFPDQPSDLSMEGAAVPFRVVSIRLEDGGRIYLGLSEIDQLRVLKMLQIRFVILWLLIVLFGFAAIFMTTRGMLSHVQTITEAASRIGRSDLRTRVPMTGRKDEVESLASTLNIMLDRIESSMHQLHTITDSLAHDIRSPLTAMRGRLEELLAASGDARQTESIVSCIDMVDRLSQFLTESLDVAEAHADALRLSRGDVDLNEALKTMIDLYQPGMAEKDISIAYCEDEPLILPLDAALFNRVLSNLFDNELTHLPDHHSVVVNLEKAEDWVTLIVEDDGPGFEPDILERVFERNTKGRNSQGHGLGLAFVDAVVRAHGGTVRASNRRSGGARIVIGLPRRERAIAQQDVQGNQLERVAEL